MERSIGVEDEQIICLALDDDENIQYRNPLELGKYIRSMTTDESKTYYVFLDEIQKVVTIQNPYIQGVEDKIGFVDVVLGLMKHDNIDVYVTGSNSKMLSSDILTEFRGRGDEIRVNPLRGRQAGRLAGVLYLRRPAPRDDEKEPRGKGKVPAIPV